MCNDIQTKKVSGDRLVRRRGNRRVVENGGKYFLIISTGNSSLREDKDRTPLEDVTTDVEAMRIGLDLIV